jgi:glycosyltransferase involved in cell wall biosynthesis
LDHELLLAFCSIRSHAIYFRAAGRNPALPPRNPITLHDGLQRLMCLPLTGAQIRFRDWMLKEETIHLNRYLRSHPDHHRFVIAARREHRLEGIELPRLNRGVGRDLAILYTAVPYADTSANVAARRIRDAQVLVDVLSANMGLRLPTDDSTQRIWEEFVDQRAETDTTPVTAWWPGINEFCRKGLAKIRSWERSKGRYRSLYSRTMHPASHVLAAWYKIRTPGVVWTAEFSDPILHNIHGRERNSTGRSDPLIMNEFREALLARGVRPPETENMYVWIEILAYTLADRLLFTNEDQLAYMLDHFADRSLVERARARAVIAPHPTLPRRFYEEVPSSYVLDREAVNIGYFGVFYATRGLTEVLDALRSLNPETRKPLRLHVFTNLPDDLGAKIAELGLDDVVLVRGFVDFLEYLNLTTRLDVLLVNDAQALDTHERNPYLPSKLSDYLGSGRPIWGVVEPGSQLGRRDLAYRSELGDVAGARVVLERIVTDLATRTPVATRSGRR